MRTKHHVMLYTFLSLALLTAVFVALSASLEARRVARALEDSYAQRVLEAQEHLQAIGLKLAKAPVAAGVETQVELLCGVSRQARRQSSRIASSSRMHFFVTRRIGRPSFFLTLYYQTASGFARRRSMKNSEDFLDPDAVHGYKISTICCDSRGKRLIFA